MSLRLYQETASLNVRKALARLVKVILCSPTGSGKTIIATDFVLKAIQKGLKVLFLCDREELIEQAANKFIQAGIDFQVVDSSTKYIRSHSCILGMVETYYRRLSAARSDDLKIDLIILDEAHIGNYRKILEMYPTTMTIGLTATPISSSVNYPLNKYFKGIVIAESNPSLIKDGWLVPAIEIGHNQLLNFKVIAGDFDNRSQIEQFNQFNIDQKMIRAWEERASTRQTICYNINIDHNNRVYEHFKNKKISVAAVDSNTPKDERKRIFSAYQRGMIQVLCNVGIYTKGTDSPQTSCIIENFGTASTSKHQQIIGRGGRPFPGKIDFIIIDMAQNVLRHGSFNEGIDWEYLFNNEERDKNFTVKKTIKLCPTCFTYHTNKFIPICQTCGTDLTATKLISLENMMPDSLTNKPIHEMTFNELQIYAKFKGYKRGWAWMQRFGNTARKKYA